GSLATMLVDDGHDVVCLDQDLSVITSLADQAETDPVPRWTATIAGQASNLPFADRVFDVVTCAQVLHKLAPGLALTEIARVLRPGGARGVGYTTRDGTVPWEKRLTRLVQE